MRYLRIVTLTLILVMAAVGCLEKQPGAAYSSHVVLHGGLDYIPNQLELLEPFDYIITSLAAGNSLDPALEPKMIAYIDPWIIDYADSAGTGYTAWQASPLDEGGPLLKMHWSPPRYGYAYRLRDDYEVMRHLVAIKRWVHRAVELHPDLAGIFVDDMGPKDYWPAPVEEKVAAWGEDWNTPAGRARFGSFLDGVEEVVSYQLAKDTAARPQGPAFVVVNGPWRKMETTKRFAENVGHGKETWAALNVDGVDAWRRFKPGDFLELYALSADGRLGAAGQADLKRCAAIVLAAGEGSIGVQYGERPDVGSGSLCSLPLSSWGDPKNWPGYSIRQLEALGGK